jgi:spore germination cell wall hydrolase CwlJ-like protein
MLLRIFLSIIVSFVVVFSTIHTLRDVPQPKMFTDFSLLVFTKDAQKEIECLADNIFFESAYEPYEGKKAVAFVTLNRVNSKHFPNDICGVVKQRTARVCQFSWYCEEKPNRLSYTKELTKNQQKVYNEIYELAAHVYVNNAFLKDPTNGALFYHADYVSPGWKNMIHTATIGRHIFYVRRDLA